MSNRTLLITRHPGAVAWLRSRGIEGELREQLDPKTLSAPTRIVGVLPTLMVEELLAAGHEVILLVLPQIPRDQRGTELTPAEMDAAGAGLRRVVALRTEVVS